MAQKPQPDQPNDAFSLAPLAKPPFIQKGYYVPLVLANGVDFIQVDMTGSTAWKDHIKGYVSAWYKKGRPNAADPVALVRPYYVFVSDRGRVEPGDFSQHFDPGTGIVRTRLSFYQLELELETYLTEDHTLVETYRVLENSSRHGEMLFYLLFYNRTYSGKPISIIPADRSHLRCVLEDGIPSFYYRFGSPGDRFAGKGLMSVKALQGSPRIQACQESDFLLRTAVGNLKAGTVFSRCITLVDNRDTRNWRREADRIHRHYLTAPVASQHAEGPGRWQEFAAKSAFSCPDQSITRLFTTSLYVCRASLHPNGSTVSALAHPNNHGMGTYWDVWYTHSALLRTNRIPEAERIVRFWQSVWPDGRRIAREHYGVRGARFEWTYRWDGKPTGYSDQVHSNTLPGIMLWNHYCYTGDRKVLADSFAMLCDSALFLIDFALKTDGKEPYLKELYASDESPQKKRNELTTAICLKKAIVLAQEAGRLLGRQVPAEVAAAEEPVDRILASLKKNGIYLPYEGADTGTWAQLVAALHFPDPRMFRKLAPLVLAGCGESRGLSIGQASRMRCTTFPWVEGMAAWAMALNGYPDAWKYLLGMDRFTNFHGGIPEYVWNHGEPSRDWFVAAHGVFVTALADLMVRMNNDTLTLFPPGLDAMPWNALSFERFRVEGGILVSLAMDRRKNLRLVLENDTEEPKSFRIKGPNCDERITLKSGKRLERKWRA